MSISKDKRFLIVGLGLIGGSYAAGLKEQGYHVGALTRSRKTIDYALSKGMIDEGTTELSKGFISSYDIVVFSLYPKTFIDWIAANQDLLKPGALITDATGVKCSVVYKVQEILRRDLEFVPAHPMAGRETSGVEYAASKIFKGANYIVTPTDANTEKGIEDVKEIGRILGFGRISVLSPEKHDEMIGFLSQLTHCIAVSLMTCKDSEDLASFSGDSFRDLTRIAKINDEMWPELFMMNKKELLSQMDLFASQFSKLRQALVDDDVEGMRMMMRLSTERRKLFDKKI